MTENALTRAKPIFQAVADLDPEEREAFVSRACAGDAAVRSLVERLLAHDRQDLGGFLEPQGASTVEASDREALRNLGPYTVYGKLGEGASAVVFAAEQTRPFRRRVALKVLKAGMDTNAVLARFEAERQALALMDHPNVAKVFDAGETEHGRSYFVMEYVPGVPITEHCDTLRLDLRQRLELFMQVCAGIQHAHQKALIHRDIKPFNVLVAMQDSEAVPKVIDFGVAKALAHPLTLRSVHTELGQLIGTPVYMSPEQAEMTAQGIDTRTDVYSLGAMLYELLVGPPPFDGRELRRGGLEGIRRTLREVDPPKPSARVRQDREAASVAARDRRTTPAGLVSQLREDLDLITMKALAKDRSLRYSSPHALAADIGRHLRDEPVDVSPPNTVYRMRKFIRRHRVGVSMVTAAFVFLAGFATFAWTQARTIAAERDRANEEAEEARQVSEFLTGLFAVLDPGEAKGEVVTALDVLDEGVQKMREELGEQPEVQAQVMDAIGEVYRKLGFYDRARPLLEQALAIRRKILGEEHPETLASMNQLAILEMMQERYAEAEPLLVEALEGRRRALGNEHPETLKSMNNLAVLCKEEERYDEAERLYREVLAVRKRTLGEDHRDTLGSKTNLAVLLKTRERYEEAERLYLESLDAQRRTLGNDHPETLTTMNNIANLYVAQNRYEEAEPLYLEALEARVRVLGTRHPSTNNTRFSIAGLMAETGRPAEAMYWLRQAMENGFSDLRIIDSPDLVSLYGDPEFEEIVAEVRRRNEGEAGLQ